MKSATPFDKILEELISLALILGLMFMTMNEIMIDDLMA